MESRTSARSDATNSASVTKSKRVSTTVPTIRLRALGYYRQSKSIRPVIQSSARHVQSGVMRCRAYSCVKEQNDAAQKRGADQHQHQTCDRAVGQTRLYGLVRGLIEGGVGGAVRPGKGRARRACMYAPHTHNHN